MKTGKATPLPTDRTHKTDIILDRVYDYLLFLGEIVTVVVAIGIILSLIGGMIMKAKQEQGDEQLETKKLNERFKAMKNSIERHLVSEHELKLKHKLEKAAKKAEDKANKKANKEKAKALKTKTASSNELATSDSSDGATADSDKKKRVFVLEFNGDMRASAVDHLREEITAILTVADKSDEVLVKVESPGGVVHGYGLAASQLKRIRDRDIKLTIAVDKVAASGGYLMACVANEIIAAPFAIIGSIGVVFSLPNFSKLLKKNDIEYEQITAGEYKRTLTVFGENDDEDRAKMKEDIEVTHKIFKDFIAEHRPQVDLEKVATGEHWHASEALDLQLVDKLQTSDDYLLNLHEEAELYQIKHSQKKKLTEKIFNQAESSLERVLGITLYR